MIVARKKDGRVVVGITIDEYSNSPNNQVVCEENIPFLKVRGMKDCYVFLDYSSRTSDILRYHPEVFKNINDENGIYIVFKKIKDLLIKYKRVIDKSKLGVSILIVSNNRMFRIANNPSSAGENDDFTVFYDYYITGEMEYLKDLPADQAIVQALRNHQAMQGECMFPLLLVDTKTHKKTIIYN